MPPLPAKSIFRDSHLYLKNSKARVMDKFSNPKPKASLSQLPTELVIEIMKFLGPAGSTCFGLTCQRYYPIHRDLFGSVSLQTQQSLRLLQDNWKYRHEYISLATCLLDWIPDGLGYRYVKGKFAPVDRGREDSSFESEAAWRTLRRYKDGARKDLVVEFERGRR